MTLQASGDFHNEDVVVVMASSIPPGYDQLTSTPATELAAATFGGENSDSDYRLTLFIASSSFIILTLITIIGVVACFILCNEDRDFTRNQKSLIHSLSSTSALNLMASSNTHMNNLHSSHHSVSMPLHSNHYLEQAHKDLLVEDHIEEEEDHDGDYGGNAALGGYRVTLEAEQKQRKAEEEEKAKLEVAVLLPHPPKGEEEATAPPEVETCPKKVVAQQQPKIAPPRPPRMKKNLHESGGAFVSSKNCVCKSKTNVETKSVGCGSDLALSARKSATKQFKTVKEEV